MKVWVVIHEQYVPYSIDHRVVRGVFETETAAIAFVDGQENRKPEFEIEEYEVRSAS